MAISLQILVLPHISWFYPHSLLSYLSHPFVDKILVLSSMPKNAPQKKTWSICDRPQTKKTLIWLVMVIFHWNSKKNRIKLPIQFNRRPRRAKLLHCLCSDLVRLVSPRRSYRGDEQRQSEDGDIALEDIGSHDPKDGVGQNRMMDLLRNLR